jgi:phage terminase small subunit
MDRPEKPALTLKQKRFIEEYACDGNATQAYFRAFGRTTSKGTRRSYLAAQVQSSRLLLNPIVAAEVKAAQDAYAARIRVTKARVLKEVAAVAFADPADAFDPDPNGGPLVAKKLHDIPAATRRAIQSVKVKRRRIAGGGNEVYEVEEVEYKFASKMDALEKLFKKLGFYAGDPEEAAKTLASVVRTVAVLPDNGRGPKPLESDGSD